MRHGIAPEAIGYHIVDSSTMEEASQYKENVGMVGPRPLSMDDPGFGARRLFEKQ